MSSRRAKRAAATPPPRQLSLQIAPELDAVERILAPITAKVWSGNKAGLVRHYLRLFTYITKGGSYLDLFAGPQDENELEAWCARLVIEQKPRWLTGIYLFESKPSSVTQLEAMLALQPPRDLIKREKKRVVRVIPGDSNAELLRLLTSGEVSRTAPAFALLDQRTFECDWATVRALADYKPGPTLEHPRRTKVELFYFLPINWLGRALKNLKNPGPTLERWWGREDWPCLFENGAWPHAQRFMDRFRDELKYGSVKAWPIFEGPGSSRIMYFMIHASDHREAPAQMARAYKLAVVRPPPVAPGQQLGMPWSPRVESWPPGVPEPEPEGEQSDGARGSKR